MSLLIAVRWSQCFSQEKSNIEIVQANDILDRTDIEVIDKEALEFVARQSTFSHELRGI